MRPKSGWSDEMIAHALGRSDADDFGGWEEPMPLWTHPEPPDLPAEPELDLFPVEPEPPDLEPPADEPLPLPLADGLELFVPPVDVAPGF